MNQTDSKKPASGEDSSTSPIPHHLIFVVHGMGNQWEGMGKFNQNLSQLRTACSEVIAEDFDQPWQIEWVPIEWHSLLHQLETVDARMKKVTLPTCSVLRMVSNDTLADVLYYFSAFHGQTIIDIITKSLNDAYASFMDKYPTFNGKIAIFGHSLGGVICYDILANQDLDVAQGEGKSGLPRSHTDVKFSKINFNPDFLFAVGSPIAGVLIIRGQSFHEYRIRTKTKFFNLFHLYDPMAYRLEPLLDDKYIEMSPVLLERPTSKSTFSQLSYYREQLQSYLSSTQLPSLALPAFTLPALSSLTLAKESLNRQFATMIDSVSSVGLPSIFSAPKDVPKTTAHKRKHSETEEPMQGTPRKSPRLAKTRLVKHPVSHKHYNEKDGKILLSKTQVVSSPPNASVEMTRKTSSSPITTQLLAGVSAVNESFTSIIEKVVKKIKINRSEKEQGTTTAFASSLKSSSLLNLPKVNSSLGTSASAVMLSPRDTPSTSPNRKDAAQETLKRSATSSVEHAELNSPLDMSQRIDFFVQESLIDNNVHQFLLGLKSHFSYWWNKDIHHFIVKNLVQSPSSSSSSLEEGVDVAVKVNAKADSFSL